MTSYRYPKISKRRSIFSPITEYQKKYSNVFRAKNETRYRDARNRSETKPISTGHVHGEECLKKNLILHIDDDPEGKVQEQLVENPVTKQVCFKNDSGTPKRMNWNNYHRLDVIHSLLDDLEYDYPSICTSGVIGKSLEGRDLKILKISNSDASNASVWMDAGIHAREWIAPAVNTYIADYIARNFNSLPPSVTNKDWYFLPVVNPDGYEYSLPFERSNVAYGYGGPGSSDTPTHAFFRGPEAFSEPESCAVRDILTNAGVSFKVYITLHSYGQVILFPFAFTDKLCPDYIRLLEGATVMSKAIYDCNNNIYKVGISRDVMYGASGTSNDWSYGAAHIPYCYLIELRSKQHKFRLPREEIEETGNEILNCVKALMEFIDNRPLEKKEPTEI